MEYTFKKDDFIINRRTIQVRTLLEDFNDQKIDLNPLFQRKFKNKIKSSIIESILLGVPISQIYGTEYDDNGKTKRYIIDGKQRLSTIISFCNGKQGDENLKETNQIFRCKKFKVLTELNGKSFEDLNDNLKSIIREYEIPIIQIKMNNTEADFKQVLTYIFEIVNTTSKPLTKGEVRKAIYDGEFFQKFIQLGKEEKELIKRGKITKEENFLDFILQVVCILSGHYDEKNLSYCIEKMLIDKSEDKAFAKKGSSNIKKLYTKEMNFLI